MKEDVLGYLNDFITIETEFSEKDNRSDNRGWETSEYASVKDMFESHLGQTRTAENYENLDIFRLKVGDKLKLVPTTWAVKFGERHNITAGDENYEHSYVVENVELTMYSRNPIAEGEIPKLKVKIILKKI